MLNFIIRLTRGSGLRGLVSFNKKSSMNNISIERPLLNFKKNELVFIASHVFKDFISSSLRFFSINVHINFSLIYN